MCLCEESVQEFVSIGIRDDEDETKMEDGQRHTRHE